MTFQRRHSIALALVIGLSAVAGCQDRNDDTVNRDDVPMTDSPTADVDAATDADVNADATAGIDPATDGAAPAPGTTAADAGATAQGSANASADERAALGVLNAINEHEIAAGKQALDKGVSGDVAEYARMMIDEHTRNQDQTNTFAPDANAADAQAQRKQGEQELHRLDAKSGDGYSKAYVDAMVKGHTEALATLDDKLIPKATTDAVRQHLTSTREHVAKHLERAKTLQGNTK